MSHVFTSKSGGKLYIGNVFQASSITWLKHHKISYIVNATSELGNFFPKTFKYTKLNWNDSDSQRILESLKKVYPNIANFLNKGNNALSR